MRQAKKEDFPSINQLAKSKAVNLQNPIIQTCEQLVKDGLETNPPKFYCLVAADCKDEILGYVLYTFTYSTWEGRMLFMHDLCSRPGNKSVEVEQNLFKNLCQVATDRKCSRLQFHSEADSALSKRLEAIDLTVEERWHQYRLPSANYSQLIQRFSSQDKT